MAKTTLKPTICLFLLAIALSCANSARILDESSSLTDQSSASSLPSGQSSDSVPFGDGVGLVDPPLPDPTANVPDVPGPPALSTVGQGPAALSAEPSLSFFMHNVMGGTSPSARVVAGIVATSGITGVPFSERRNNIFPLTGGIPIPDGNLENIPNINGIINNNNLPYIAGLSGARLKPKTIIENTGNNDQVQGGTNQPFVTAGQLPAGSTIQQLMFGSITVFDDELTEGHELGSAVIGRAQGLYLSSSLDGTSHTVAATLLIGNQGGDRVVEDSISLFGVHRTATEVSEVAVIGGTGKYEHAKGYATMESVQAVDSHMTDGVDMIYHFSIYLSE